MKRAVKVVGMVAGGREAVVAGVSVHDPVLLVPEPDNPHDPNAVAVHVCPADQAGRVVSSVVDPSHVGAVAYPEAFRQAGYLPRAVAEQVRLPDGGIIGWVSRTRTVTDYTPLGEHHDRVVGFDVTAWLPRPAVQPVPTSDYL